MRPYLKSLKSARAGCRLGAVSAVVLLMAQAPADMLVFNSPDPSANVSTRASWLSAIGISSPNYLVDFETGFSHAQNVSGIPGLFPGNMVITDTSSANLAQVITGAGLFSGSNPVGAFALRQNEDPYLEFDFAGAPVDYFAIQDIDQAHTTGIVTFVGGSTTTFSIEGTVGSGDSAEFWGIYRNDRPQIVRVQFDASGDTYWGVDNIEYGAVPEPASLIAVTTGLALAAFRKRRC